MSQTLLVNTARHRYSPVHKSVHKSHIYGLLFALEPEDFHPPPDFLCNHRSSSNELPRLHNHIKTTKSRHRAIDIQIQPTVFDSAAHTGHRQYLLAAATRHNTSWTSFLTHQHRSIPPVLIHLQVLRPRQHGQQAVRVPATEPKKAQTTPTKAAQSPTPVIKPSPPPPKVIDVYAGGNFVGSVPRATLTRFSIEAALCLPKRGPSTEDTEGRAPVAKVVTPADRSVNKQLHVVIEGVTEGPDVDAVKLCLDWMAANSAVGGGLQHLLSLAPEDIENYATDVIVDIYAAAWCLDMCPASVTLHPLRAVLMQRLSNNMPTIDLLHHIHARIPDFDPVFARAVTAYFEWCDGTEYGRLHEKEAKAISDYVKANKALNDKFSDIQHSRRKKQYLASKAAKAAKRAAAKEELQKGWDAFKDSVGTMAIADDKSEAADAAAPAATTAPSAPSPAIEKKGNGKGVGGKHVPGA